MLTLEICNSCKEVLADYGEVAYQTFFDICLSYIVERRYYPHSQIMPICEFLERKGYVVSMDSDTGPVYKPQGLRVKEEDSEAFIFCLNCKD